MPDGASLSQFNPCIQPYTEMVLDHIRLLAFENRRHLVDYGRFKMREALGSHFPSQVQVLPEAYFAAQHLAYAFSRMSRPVELDMMLAPTADLQALSVTRPDFPATIPVC